MRTFVPYPAPNIRRSAMRCAFCRANHRSVNVLKVPCESQEDAQINPDGVQARCGTSPRHRPPFGKRNNTSQRRAARSPRSPKDVRRRAKTERSARRISRRSKTLPLRVSRNSCSARGGASLHCRRKFREIPAHPQAPSEYGTTSPQAPLSKRRQTHPRTGAASQRRCAPPS